MLIWCDYAWLPDGPAPDVLIGIENGRITAVTLPADLPADLRTDLRAGRPVDLARVAAHSPGSSVSSGPPAQDQREGRREGRQVEVGRRAGLTLPGFANAHSHAFHRALRGRTQAGQGDFWTWRERMYQVAAALDPDSYHRLARAVYGEMALAGITSVGEFHYLHHAPDGSRYADPNAMGHALIAAARDAGIRITLLDTLYLTGSVDGKALAGPQVRFSDGSLSGWSERLDRLRADNGRADDGRADDGSLIGAALHSVRAVPADLMPPFAALTAGLPVHAHVSEQRAENEACLAAHGRTPVGLLHDAGMVGPDFTAVHATHLTEADIGLLAGAAACFCPSTERDLGDGIGPARALADAGVTLNLGSDSHAVIDPFEEARALELNQRLADESRGRFTPAELLRAATVSGHASLGWKDAGQLAVGQRADLVTVSLDSIRTAGIEPSGVLFAAGAADVTHVLADGREIVRDGRHVSLDVARELRETITCLF